MSAMTATRINQFFRWKLNSHDIPAIIQQSDLITFEVEDGRTVLKPYRDEMNPFASYAGALDSFDTEEEVNT